jgi:protein TonB
MYEAVRQRAPNSTQIAGAATTVLIMTVTGYGLMNGLGVRIARVFDPPVVLATIPDAPEEQPPPEIVQFDTNTTLTMPDPTWVPDDEFFLEPPPLVVKKKEVGAAKIGPAVIGPAAPVRILPRLRSTNEKPPYPAASVRAQEEGATGIEVCVDARGRVTSASLAQSSGHARLDEAALKWVRGARFTPGSADGAPQAMCGHNVIYEWTLEDGRS